MDYRTLFLFDIVSLAIYSGAMLVLALRNRRITGMSWFAASVFLELVKAVLQSLRATLPHAIAVLLANQLIVLSFFAMYMGFRWFLYRTPIRPWRAWLLFFGTVGLYVLLCLTRSKHPFILSMPPGAVLCILAVWLLLRHGKGAFRAAARAAAAVLLVELGVDAYRIFLIFSVYGNGAEPRYLVDSRWLFTILATMLVEASLVLLYVWFFVTESHSELRESALTDSLTGVLNRRALAAESEREISRSRRSRTPLSLIVLDIDFFKSINDRHGHHGGDQALRVLADLLRRELRQIDIIARLGGEEFVLLLPHTDLQGATLLAEKLRHTLAGRPIALVTGMVHMTFTAGVAQLQDSDTGFDPIIQRADQALYRGKAQGRNRVIIAGQRSLYAAEVALVASPMTAPDPSSFLIQ